MDILNLTLVFKPILRSSKPLNQYFHDMKLYLEFIPSSTSLLSKSTDTKKGVNDNSLLKNNTPSLHETEDFVIQQHMPTYNSV